jgi:DNA repair protein RadD
VTIPKLHEFQSALKGGVYQAWQQGARNVLMRLDTGGGKTVILSEIIRDALALILGFTGFSCVMAHRHELVSQLSMTLAKYGIRHNIIASADTIRAIAKLHVATFGYSLYDPGAKCTVASVDTIVRIPDGDQWSKMVTLWIVDEGHHLVLDNKWHRAISRFTHPDVRGLLPTATPGRADGKGLGRMNSDGTPGDGVADVMIEGPPMRWLIQNEYLTDYRIICPKSDLVVLGQVGASGDWSSEQLRAAAERSHIVGDVVSSYLTYASGLLGITFSTDVKTAAEMTAAYRLAGVRAETLTGKTDPFVRREIIRRFERREVDQIVAVDIISEGFDLPAIEVCSMARPTASLPLYMQQFGRTLRTMPGKVRALILDHVANVIRHQGPPDKPRVWSLDRRGKRPVGTDDGIPMKVCVECFEPYPRSSRACVHCGHYEPPESRLTPAAVEGDMEEMDPEVLAFLRGEVDRVMMTDGERRAELIAAHAPHVGVMAGVKRHDEKRTAQAELRRFMALWGGARVAEGMTRSEAQKTFFFRYGVDVVTAQTLDTADTKKLLSRLTGSPT